MGLDIVVSVKHFPGDSIRKPRREPLVQRISTFPLDFWLPDAMSWAVLVRCAHRQVGHSRRIVILSWGALEGSQMELNFSRYQAWVGAGKSSFLCGPVALSRRRSQGC